MNFLKAISSLGKPEIGLVTTHETLQGEPKTSTDEALCLFANTVMNGDPDRICGVFVKGRFQLRVVYQPPNKPDYVSNKPGVATLFELPLKHGNLAFLAHNDLAGGIFQQMQPGDSVAVIKGNGVLLNYIIMGNKKYQALSPNNPYSQFVDPNHPRAGTIKASDLFKEIYTPSNRVVFQTCLAGIDSNGQMDDSWGRLFVIGTRT